MDEKKCDEIIAGFDAMLDVFLNQV